MFVGESNVADGCVWSPEQHFVVAHYWEHYSELGLYNERAKHEYEVSLAMHINVYRIDSPAALIAQLEMADALLRRAENTSALIILQDCLVLKQAVSGNEHAQTLRARRNIAVAKGRLGYTEEAEAIFRDVWSICEIKLGSDHLSTIVTMEQLGLFLAESKQWNEAEIVLTDVIARFKKHGEAHSGRLSSMRILSQVLRAQGRLDEVCWLIHLCMYS